MIIKDWTFQGVPVPGAEHHIGTINIQDTAMSFRVDVFAPEAEASFEWRWEGGVYDPEGGDVVAQAQAILLAMPKYDGGVVA